MVENVENNGKFVENVLTNYFAINYKPTSIILRQKNTKKIAEIIIFFCRAGKTNNNNEYRNNNKYERFDVNMNGLPLVKFPGFYNKL